LQYDKGFYDVLLRDYRLIWNNRHLDLMNGNSQETLFEAIKRELLDENSHPRIRKNKYQKYYFATTRIINSDLSSEVKLQLIEFHIQIMKEIGKE